MSTNNKKIGGLMGYRFVENGGGNVSGLFIFVQMKSNNKKKSVIQFFFKKSISY